MKRDLLAEPYTLDELLALAKIYLDAAYELHEGERDTILAFANRAKKYLDKI